jgi:hypothetical protein
VALKGLGELSHARGDGADLERPGQDDVSDLVERYVSSRSRSLKYTRRSPVHVNQGSLGGLAEGAIRVSPWRAVWLGRHPRIQRSPT